MNRDFDVRASSVLRRWGFGTSSFPPPPACGQAGKPYDDGRWFVLRGPRLQRKKPGFFGEAGLLKRLAAARSTNQDARRQCGTSAEEAVEMPCGPTC